MPFQSEAQRGFMYVHHPKIAKQFEAETPKNAKLPEHVKKMSQGGFAGNWKNDLADYMNLHFSGDRQKTQHLADGGFAGDFDVDTGDSSTVRGIPYAPPPPSLPTPSAPGPLQGPVFNPQAGLPLPVPKASVVPPVAQIGPDPLQAYLAQQKTELNKYGPEEQMALEQAIQKQRTGFIPNLALAGTGLADAIMQGVARAGPSNFQSNLENRVEKTQEGQRQALEKAQAGHLAQMKQGMELAQMDPASPLSRMAQRAYGSTLKSMPGGQDLSDEQIAAIPASIIADVMSKKVDLAKALAEVENTQAWREATLEIQRGAQAENIRHAKTEEGIAKGAKQGEAARTLAGRGILSTAVNAIPFTAGHAATKVLEKQALGEQEPQFDQDVLDYAKTHGISPQAAQTQKERRMRGQ